jgi:calcineurin-like phosphoesterase family protein
MNFHAADLHFGQSNVCKYRTHFSSVQEHDTVIFENILRQLNKRSTLYLHGDICFSEESLKYIEQFRETGATVILIGGNHCTDKIPLKRLCEVYSAVYFYQNKYGFTLSHMPLHPEHLRGKLNVHGHLHDKVIDDPRYLNVSLEQTNYHALSLDHIREIFSERISSGKLCETYKQSLKLL